MKTNTRQFLIFLLTYFMAATSWASCQFTQLPVGNGQGTLSITLNVDLANVQNKPNNTLLFESPAQKYYGYSNYICNTYSTWGVKNNAGTDSLNTDVFPIGDTGFAWQWIYNGTALKGTGAYRAVLNGITGFTQSTHTMRLLKIGKIKNGATIPSGILGYVQVEGFVQPLAMVINNETTVTPAVCQASAKPVYMGDDYRLEEFKKAGATARIIKFNINLDQCESGISQVTYSLLATSTSPVIDQQQGIVRLSNNQNSAKGIALQLMDDAGRPLALNTTYPFKEFNTTGKHFSIPLSAAYYRLAGATLAAGTANAAVTFIVNYL